MTITQTQAQNAASLYRDYELAGGDREPVDYLRLCHLDTWQMLQVAPVHQCAEFWRAFNRAYRLIREVDGRNYN